jgi:hypothetical protein
LRKSGLASVQTTRVSAEATLIMVRSAKLAAVVRQSIVFSWVTDHLGDLSQP